MKTLGKRHHFAFIIKMIYRHKNVGLRNYTFDSYFDQFGIKKEAEENIDFFPTKSFEKNDDQIDPKLDYNGYSVIERKNDSSFMWRITYSKI